MELFKCRVNEATASVVLLESCVLFIKRRCFRHSQAGQECALFLKALLILTQSAMAAGFLHPTINVDNPEDEVDMEVIVGTQKQQLDVNVALSNSFGFGGHNSSILFRAFKD